MSLRSAFVQCLAWRRWRPSVPLLSVPLLLALMAVVMVGFYASHGADAVNTVTLPIRVYAPNGTDAHVESVTLNTSHAGSVDRLWVQAHQPFYHRGGVEQGVQEGFDPEGAAEIRVNGGAWVEVRDENVECAFPESSYDCVAGIYSTIRFSIPAPGIVPGSNTIEFKYNGTEGIRSGYRVLELGLMRASDDIQDFDPFTDSAADGTTLEYEDFSAWGPPLTDPSDIQAGETLFTSLDVLVADGESQAPIHAACSSCHARDGRDLKYFNFSNRVIEARSRYHGLSQTQAEQIASYIRSIQLEKENGQPYQAPGTPWDPPYQPGPSGFGPNGNQGPDEADQVFWAAGAGLDWVLDRDEEMKPYLFPDGSGGVDRFANGDLNWHHLSTDSTLNMRALPVAVQFPDWNNWLPDIHPLDISNVDFEGGQAKARYEGQLRNALEAGDLSDIDRQIKKFTIDWRADNFDHFDQPADLTENEWAMARMSADQWRVIKIWESFHLYHLENVADEMYCGSEVAPYCEPRGWMGRVRTAFALGPHLSGVNSPKGPPFVYGSSNQDFMLTHLWYHLQLIINPGTDPLSSGQNPVDWNYQKAYIQSSARYGVDATLRKMQSMTKNWQERANGYGVDGSGGNGYNPTDYSRSWSMYTTTPIRLMYMDRQSGIYLHTSQRDRSDYLEAMLRVWWDYNSRFPIAEFPRGTGKIRYDPPTETQSMSDFAGSREIAERLYQEMPLVRDQLPEVSRGVLDSISTWGGQMWPYTQNPSWDELIGEPSGDPTVSITNLANGNTFIAPVDLTVEVDAYDSGGGAVSSVTFVVDGTEMGEDTSAPYRFSWQDVAAGRYEVTARAVDEEGRSGSSAPLTITVLPEGDGTETSQSIILQEGTNFVSSRVQPWTASLDRVFADVPGLVGVLGEDGRAYDPEASDNSLSRWSVLRSYFILTQESDTLQVTGPQVSCTTTAISLQEGWNFIPYLCEQAMAPEEAFAAISGELVRVKDGAGNAYMPAQGVDNIELLEPGKGYKVLVSEDAAFTYPPQAQASRSGGGQPPVSTSSRRR